MRTGFVGSAVVILRLPEWTRKNNKGGDKQPHNDSHESHKAGGFTQLGHKKGFQPYSGYNPHKLIFSFSFHLSMLIHVVVQANATSNAYVVIVVKPKHRNRYNSHGLLKNTIGYARLFASKEENRKLGPDEGSKVLRV